MIRAEQKWYFEICEFLNIETKNMKKKIYQIWKALGDEIPLLSDADEILTETKFRKATSIRLCSLVRQRNFSNCEETSQFFASISSFKSK